MANEIRFGIIGCGLMGAEFASAAARWCHLPSIGRARRNRRRLQTQGPGRLGWFTDNMSAVTTGGHATIASCWPTPRSRRSTAPCRTICTRRSTATSSTPASTCWARSRSASIWRPTRRSWPCIAAAPAGLRALLVRVPLLPRRVADRRLHRGRAASARSSRWRRASGTPATSTRSKPINWKRQIAVQRRVRLHGRPGDARRCTSRCASAGCRATCAPCCRRSSPSGPTARAAWRPARRGTTPSWRARSRPHEQHFPMLLSTKRIAPGETNTWFIRVHGTEFSAEFSHEAPQDAAHDALPAGRPAGLGDAGPAATPAPTRPSPAASSSSASPTPCCRCGRPSAMSW